MNIKKTSAGIAVVYAIIIGVAMLDKGSVNDVQKALTTLLLFALVISPQVALLFSIRNFAAHYAKVILLVTQIAFFVLSLLMFYGTFYNTKHIDAQAGLAFIWLPIWQILGVAIVEVILVVIRYIIIGAAKISDKKNQ